MGLFKTRDDRFEGITEVIEKHAGRDAATLIETSIENLGTTRNAIGDALSLGSRSTSGDAETERRNAIRAVLYLLFTEGKQPTGLAASFKEKYRNWTLGQLVSEMKSRLPLLISSPNRDSWDPNGFSPATDPPPPGFRYIVFAMMNTYTGRGVSYDAILDKPTIVRSFALSTSLIGDGHVASYYPYGLILRVPKENIVSAHAKDQAFKNYKAHDPANPMSLAEMNDLRNEIRRVGATYSLSTPDDILSRVKPNSEYGYSEIVVLGSNPMGGTIQVAGFFMKVDSTGAPYVRPGRKNETAFVTGAIATKMRNSGLPIVRITDTSGAGS